MDINTLRGLGTVFALIAFVGICLWAYSSKRKNSFNEAANLPFADDVDDTTSNQFKQNDEERATK